MYISPERAARAIKALVDYGRWLSRIKELDSYLERYIRRIGL